MIVKNEVFIYNYCDAVYPLDSEYWLPDTIYPELKNMYDHTVANNNVFMGLRELFYSMGLDKNNFGTSIWNPLSDGVINEGDKVLIKPNFVIDKNDSGSGLDCLCTHPSVIAALVPYIWKALKYHGRIVIADAPLQSCDFDNLCDQLGLNSMISFFKRKGINIELKDLRGIKSEVNDGILVQETCVQDHVIVKLNNLSAHSNLSKKQINRERITCYNPKELKLHHNEHIHEYCISKDVLDADIIFNIPKPKSHRYAGVTICMKNFVGINVRKEYLPHHRVGDPSVGGDEYSVKSKYLEISSKMMDLRNVYMNKGNNIISRFCFLISKLLEHSYKIINPKNSHTYGSWYGNDTIWRTIVDLNKIIYFSDKEGTIHDVVQRKIFNIADMIVSGDGEGPLTPKPVKTHMLVAGYDTVQMDKVIVSIMGFNLKKIPLYKNIDKFLNIYNYNVPLKLMVNGESIDSSVKSIRSRFFFRFSPSSGWMNYIEL